MKYLIFIPFFLLFSCSVAQKNKVVDNQNKKDIELNNLYKKFSDNRFDYGENARDTILNHFKKTLLKTLANKEYADFPFDSLSKNVKIISSKDKKLRLFSWDEFNSGTWHHYNSAYQYDDNNQSYSGILSLEKERLTGKLLYTDITHFKIEKIEKGLYLTKGYGTHGSGLDFYVFRLLSLKNNKVTDCDKCFDGKDRFVFEKPRAFNISPKYNAETQEISYPEMVISYFEGEDSGFTKPTKKILTLKFKDGVFYKIKN